jgi:hypothetical protein
MNKKYLIFNIFLMLFCLSICYFISISSGCLEITTLDTTNLKIMLATDPTAPTDPIETKPNKLVVGFFYGLLVVTSLVKIVIDFIIPTLENSNLNDSIPPTTPLENSNLNDSIPPTTPLENSNLNNSIPPTTPDLVTYAFIKEYAKHSEINFSESNINAILTENLTTAEFQNQMVTCEKLNIVYFPRPVIYIKDYPNPFVTNPQANSWFFTLEDNKTVLLIDCAGYPASVEKAHAHGAIHIKT